VSNGEAPWPGKAALISDARGPKTGLGRYAEMLYVSLRQTGVSAIHVAPTPPTLPKVSYALAGFLGRDLRAFLKNYPLWSKYPRAEIYHLTNQTLASLLLFSRPRGRVIVTVHDIFPYMLRFDRRLRAPYRGDRLYHRLAMLGLRHADHLITVSRYTKDCLHAQLGIETDKITVVYSGVDHERFRTMPVPVSIRERYGLPRDRQYLLYVGSEDPRKNLTTVLRALAQLRHELPGVELLKLGLSHFSGERQRLVDLSNELGISSAIHFLEDVPDQDLPALYNLADVFVTTSQYEGFGFPVIEAMACGTPVVCANAGALPELVAGAAVQVCPTDADALAAQLVALLRSGDQRLALGRAGQRQAARFRWSSTAADTIDVYRG
jgi:glycosyltransferase involved in cell wall biosynthesis